MGWKFVILKFKSTFGTQLGKCVEKCIHGVLWNVSLCNFTALNLVFFFIKRMLCGTDFFFSKDCTLIYSDDERYCQIVCERFLDLEQKKTPLRMEPTREKKKQISFFGIYRENVVWLRAQNCAVVRIIIMRWVARMLIRFHIISVVFIHIFNRNSHNFYWQKKTLFVYSKKKSNVVFYLNIRIHSWKIFFLELDL